MLSTGHLLVFDNGLSRGWSRAVELDPIDKKVVWTYTAPGRTSFFTVSRGSAQRLPNGNTLLAQSDSGRAFEVTPRGATVWEYWNPFRNARGDRATIVRMRRLERSTIRAIVSRLGPGRRTAPAKPSGH